MVICESEGENDWRDNVSGADGVSDDRSNWCCLR